MARLGFVADVHVGNFKRFGGALDRGLNDRCKRVVKVLTAARQKADDLGCDVFVINGDLFDSDKPTPQIIAAVQDAIGLDSRKPATMRRVILNGNHDQHSDEPGDNALAPLREHALIVEHTSTVRLAGVDIVCVPYARGIASDWFPDAVAGVTPPHGDRVGAVVLAMHLGISDSKTAPWLQSAGDAVTAALVAEVCDDLDISYAIAGNWHDARTWEFSIEGVRIEQCGALCPTGFDNPGTEGYGQLVVLDTDSGKVTRYEIPGPRFISVRAGSFDLDDQLSAIETARERGCAIYLDMVAPAEELPELRANADADLATGRYVGIDVRPDSADTEAAARAAASAAKSSTNLLEALAAFVERMPLDDVDRQRVLDLARRYLRVG